MARDKEAKERARQAGQDKRLDKLKYQQKQGSGVAIIGKTGDSDSDDPCHDVDENAKHFAAKKEEEKKVADFQDKNQANMALTLKGKV